jgi:hypothetical protein
LKKIDAMSHAHTTASMGAIVLAQMNTHEYIWQGAGADEAQAREALLAAWAHHRARVLAQFPALASSLPEAAAIPKHFPISFQTYKLGAGYRDGKQVF